MNYAKMGLKLLFEKVDDPSIMADFRFLAALKSRISKLTREMPEHKVLSQQISALRKVMKEKAHSFYVIKMERKGLYNRQFYSELPDPMGFKEVADDMNYSLRDIRSRRKHIEHEQKNIFGFRYSTTAGVFDAKEKNSILTIGKSTDPMRRIRNPKVPHERIKANYVGIELELMCRMDHDNLAREFIKEGLAGYVHIKTDSSIQVEDRGIEQGHEVTVLCRQDDVQWVADRICKILNNKDTVDAKVNNSCGFHLHLDIRNRDPYLAYNNLVKALPLLNRLVPPDRLSNTRYCRQNTVTDLLDYFPDPKNVKGTRLNRDNRYQAINPYSILSHSTIEIRLHSGTTNAQKIAMWSRLLVAIADAPKITEVISNVDQFERLVMNDGKLSEYMHKRIGLFESKRNVDTRADWALDRQEVG